MKDEVKLKKKTKKESQLPSDAAGHVMVTDIPTVLAEATVEEVAKILSNEEFDAVDYIYVVDKDKVLKGVLPIRKVLSLSGETKVSRVMVENPTSASIYANKEHVALQALKYKIKSVPIVDTDGKLLGTVTHDAILDILHDEHLEDVLYSAGINPEDDPAREIINATAKVHIKKRLPWLIIGLFGGVLAAFVVEFFEEALRVQLAVAAFMPAVVYMSNAVGSQSQIIFIRSMALDKKLVFSKYVLREVFVNLALGAILGTSFYIVGLYWVRSTTFAVILGASVFLTILTAVSIAMFLPWFLAKKNYDPAIASGPFATVLSDISSLVIYFGIAQLMLSLAS